MDKNIIVLGLAVLIFIVSCNQSSMEKDKENVTRHGWIIKIKPEKLDEYKALHANPWPGVVKIIKECNIRNYSIYYKDSLLFSYLEYTGDDWEADMQKMAGDSLTQEWWKLTDVCQERLSSAKEGEWWAAMEEVFHID